MWALQNFPHCLTGQAFLQGERNSVLAPVWFLCFRSECSVVRRDSEVYKYVIILHSQKQIGWIFGEDLFYFEPPISSYTFYTLDFSCFVEIHILHSQICFHFFFPFIFIHWRLITLQYCSGFCHTLTWISHGFTCVLHPYPPSHLPLHPIPLGLPSAPALSTCLMHPPNLFSFEVFKNGVI